MANHPNRTRAPATGYLWRAHASEPGCHGASFAITRTREAPTRIEGAQHSPGLVYAESIRGDWHMIGETTQPLADYTEAGLTAIGVVIRGEILSAAELAESHSYRHAT